MKCETLEQLKKEVENDIKTAIWMNPDRLERIRIAAEKVICLKFRGSE
jgi:hypothetical protein